MPDRVWPGAAPSVAASRSTAPATASSRHGRIRSWTRRGIRRRSTHRTCAVVMDARENCTGRCSATSTQSRSSNRNVSPSRWSSVRSRLAVLPARLGCSADHPDLLDGPVAGLLHDVLPGLACVPGRAHGLVQLRLQIADLLQELLVSAPESFQAVCRVSHVTMLALSPPLARISRTDDPSSLDTASTSASIGSTSKKQSSFTKPQRPPGHREQRPPRRACRPGQQRHGPSPPTTDETEH